MKRFLSGKKHLFFLALYTSDVFMFTVSAVFSMLFFYGTYTDVFHAKFLIFSLLVLLVNYSSFGLYNEKRALFDDNEFMKIVYSVLMTYILIAALILLFGDYMRLFFAVSLAFLLTIIFTTLSRFILSKIMVLFRKAGYDRKRVLFFGKPDEDLIKKIEENKDLGYDVVETVSTIPDLKKYLDKVDIVFVKKENVGDKLMGMMIENEHINWKVISSVFNLVIDPVTFDEFKDYPIVNIKPSKPRTNYQIIKRAMDILMSGTALVLLAIPFAVIALIIKITMPGPVFFKHERLGKDLKPFMLYKFRSMRVDAEKLKKELEDKNEVKGLFKIKEDPRVTPFGKFLRRTCIDELPQLINIFKGDMSIVGPRPHLKIELHNFKGWRRARFKVKPGLTGMWQVNGRHELNFDKAVLYDIYYVKHQSLMLDLSIILKTIPAIMMSRGRY